MAWPAIHVYHTVGRAEVGEQAHDLVQGLGVRAQVVPEETVTGTLVSQEIRPWVIELPTLCLEDAFVGFVFVSIIHN